MVEKEKGVCEVSKSINKIRHIRKYNEQELECFFKNDMPVILNKYKKNKYKRIILYEIITLVVDKLKSNNISKITCISNKFLDEELLTNENKIIFSFFKNANKDVIILLKRWVRSIRILGIYQYKFIEFVIAASLVHLKVDTYKIVKENKITYIIQNLRNESRSMRSYLKFYKIHKHLGLLKICDVFDFIYSAYMYDEEILNSCINLKRKYNYLVSYYNLFDVFEEKCRMKFADFYSENITSSEVERANRRYNFKWKKVNDVVFIESLIDDWYVMVNKIDGKMVLYHNNNMGIDAFHIQKVFRHTDLRKVFNVIHKHDLYSLNRFDRFAYNQLIK